MFKVYLYKILKYEDKFYTYSEFDKSFDSEKELTVYLDLLSKSTEIQGFYVEKEK